MARELLPTLDPQAVLEGHMTPIWFGSAINSFGVKELMDGIGNTDQSRKSNPPNPSSRPRRTQSVWLCF